MAEPVRPPDQGQPQLSDLLFQKERDLELAAKIGQSLLEQNKELQTRNDFLEETLAGSSDEVVQLKHELSKRIELLRVYSHYEDDEDKQHEDGHSLRRRIDRLHSENNQLRKERSSFRRAADSTADKERAHVKELSRQLDAANEKIDALQSAIGQKTDECTAQGEAVERLLHEIGQRHNKERQLTVMNEDLNRQLEEAVQRQQILQAESLELQEDYAELRGMFCEAEEELVRYRQAPANRHNSVDSLYDSLASELENSDSGFSSTAVKDKYLPSNRNLQLEISDCQSSSVNEVDVPSALLADLSRKKIAIDSAPLAPPQTPMTENGYSSEHVGHRDGIDSSRVVPECSPTKTAALVRSVTCDASTSTIAECDLLETERGPKPTSNCPSSSEALQLSEPLSAEHVPTKTAEVLAAPKIFTTPNRSTGLAKTSSQESLENYVAPKMGEPGVPGTRDLVFSLKTLKARRKVEKDFARYCNRKGLPAGSFFNDQTPVTRKSSNSSWTDYSISLGQERHRAVVSSNSIGLGGAMQSISGRGVVTRGELSPSSTPQRVCPTVSPGLASLIPNAFLSSTTTDLLGGGVLRRAL